MKDSESAFERQDGALLPCPFCGGQPKFEKQRHGDDEDEAPTYWLLSCSTCQSGPPWDEEDTSPDTLDPAADCKHKLSVKWNTRADDSLRNQNAVLREALGFYAERENYQQRLMSDVLVSEMDIDEGHRARKALEGKQ